MALEWVEDACARLLAPAPTLADLAAWLDSAPPQDGERLLVERALGAHHVLVLAHAGEPTSLSAGYELDAAPTAADAERALGPARELPRGAHGPFQLAFGGRTSDTASCFIAATTYDPPALPAGERQLIELIIRRDPARPAA